MRSLLLCFVEILFNLLIWGILRGMLKYLAFRSFLGAIQDYYPFVRGSWGVTFKGIVYLKERCQNPRSFELYC